MAGRVAVPTAPHKTLLEWIDDDGDETADSQPVTSKAEQELHAAVIAGAARGPHDDAEPIPPPAGLRLAPLG